MSKGGVKKKQRVMFGGVKTKWMIREAGFREMKGGKQSGSFGGSVLERERMALQYEGNRAI